MRRCRLATISTISSMLALSSLIACEEVEDASPTPPSGTSTSTSADGEGAKSAYGKAYERAEKLEQEIQAYQEEVIKTADGVFDDSAARRREE